MTQSSLLARIVTRIALAVAILVALSLPVGYGFVAWRDLAEDLHFKARVKAQAIESLIADNPELWIYAENRIQGVLARQPVILENEFVEVRTTQGSRITSAGSAPAAPTMQRRYELSDAGRIVGEVVVTGSLRGLMRGFFAAGGLGVIVGFLVWFAIRNVPLRMIRQVSERLEEEQDRAVKTLQAIGDGVITTDSAMMIRYANPVALQMLGMSLKEVAGRPVDEVVVLEDSATGARIGSALAQAMQTRQPASCDGRGNLVSNAALRVPIEERATPLVDRKGALAGGVLCLRDVSTARKYVERRTWEATHDALTGLPNRREFELRLERAVDGARNLGQQHVLCYLDLDRFKVVNDSCGHAAGDELLVALATLMLSRIRESDTLARIGGDEFALLLDGCDPRRGEAIARDIIAAVSDYHFRHGDQTFTVGLSIGLTSISGENQSAAEVQGEADSACAWAKEQGRGRVCTYVASNRELAARRSEIGWVSRISAAIEEDRFVLYHQTFQTLDGGGQENVHLEVLLRMVDENGQIVLPARFLPAAERFNLIGGIDRWVIREVFSNFARIAEKFGNVPITVNINLSGASICAEWLLPLIREVTGRYGVDPASICFEITETVAVRYLQTAVGVIEECRAMGFRFALDDFGTGTSSFGYLRKLPVDYLKIDGSFVRNIHHDQVDRAMTETINEIGHLLGKRTIAEYVEDERIIGLLQDMKVDYAQGFAVSKPQPLFD